MNDNRIRIHSAEIRETALELYGEGFTAKQIAARLCLPYEAVRYWCVKSEETIMIKKRTKTKSGSGVIAPSAYARGYRWGGVV